MVELNPHYISELNTGGALNQIVDGVDFPHTGLFKALQQIGTGNFVIRDNTNDFDITQSSSNPVVSVAVGSYFDNGEKKTTSAQTFDDTDFTFTTSKAYYLIVINSSGTVALRVPDGADKVAEHDLGDTIIAMIEIADDTAFGSRKVQYFTTDKTKNSLSIGQNNGGSSYIEEGKITAPSGASGQGIDIETTTSNSDIRITPNGTGEVVFSSPLVTTSNGDLNLAPHGSGKILLGESSSADLQVTTFGQRALELSTNSGSQTGKITIDNGPNGDITIAPTGSGKIILNDGANAINFPTSDGNADEVLTTDGSGQLSFASVDLSSKQDAISGDTLTDVTVTIATDDKVLIQDTSDSNNLKTVTTQAIADLYVETQTLDDVTNEGATTNNNITVGDATMGDATMSDATMNNATINTKLFLSKVGSLDANSDAIVQYIDASQNSPANQYTLPVAASVDGAVYIIKNLNASNPMNIITSGSDVFENNVVSSDTRYVNTAQLTLKPLQSVMLQAINDAIVISLDTPNALLSGWMILESDIDTNTGIANVVDDTSPQLGGMLDVNGNAIGNGTLELLKFSETASAVNEFTIANAAQGGAPKLSATGGDANVGIEIETKGTGEITLDGDVVIDGSHTFTAPILDSVSSSSSSDYTLSKATNGGKYLIFSGTGDVILPSTSTNGEQYTILNVSGSDITVDPNGNNINNSSNDITVGSYNGVTCIAIGSNNWIALGV